MPLVSLKLFNVPISQLKRYITMIYNNLMKYKSKIYYKNDKENIE